MKAVRTAENRPACVSTALAFLLTRYLGGFETHIHEEGVHFFLPPRYQPIVVCLDGFGSLGPYAILLFLGEFCRQRFAYFLGVSLDLGNWQDESVAYTLRR